MLNETECLTYPDLVSRLSGISDPRSPNCAAHIYSCRKCRDIFTTFEKFILDETTPEEMILLDTIEYGHHYEFFR